MIPLRDNIPGDRFPAITLAIIVINVFVFLFLQGPSFSLSGGQEVEPGPVVDYGAIPYRVTNPGEECGTVVVVTDQGQQEEVACQGTALYDEAVRQGVPVEDLTAAPPWLTLFTSMFMHGGWLHIFFNLLFLWVFGNNIEDAMGRPRFVLFYLLGGLAAVGAQIAVDPDSTVPVIGASGAIAGVLGAYALLYPRARVLTAIFVLFIFFVELPAMLLLGIWLALQFVPAVGQLALPDDLTGQGGVAYWAHVGGFLFGLAAIKLFAHRRSRTYDEPPGAIY